MHRGYIKIWRCIEDWEWIDHPLTFWFFIKLIFLANWEDKRWQGILIERGQFVSSVENLRFKQGHGKRKKRLTTKQVRTLISRLKTTGELASQSTSQYTLFTVVNYRKYQDHDSTMTSERANETASEGQARGKPRATTKELKELKNEKKRSPYGGSPLPQQFNTWFDRFWEAYPNKLYRESARGQLRRLKPTEEIIGKIMEGLTRWKRAESWNRDNGRYIPAPAKFLAGKLWAEALPYNELDWKEQSKIIITQGEHDEH